MKRRTVGFGLLALGVILGIVATLGVVAQGEDGKCYTDTVCTSSASQDMDCTMCFNVTAPPHSWSLPDGESPCITTLAGCDATAVTFLGFDTPITACNARSVVSIFGLAGAMLAAVGVVVLKRGPRSPA